MKYYSTKSSISKVLVFSILLLTFLPVQGQTNMDVSSATDIEYELTYSGVLNSNDPEGLYKYEASGTGIDTLSLIVPNDVNYDVYIYDENLNIIGSDISSLGVEEELYRVNRGKIYYIKIFSNDGMYSSNEYILNIKPYKFNLQTNYEYDKNGSLVRTEVFDVQKQKELLKSGLNYVEVDMDTSASLTSLKGRTLVNLLGNEGNFEEQGLWANTLTTDISTNKFGTSSGKIDNSLESIEKIARNSSSLDLSGKKVLVGVWAKSNSANSEIELFLIGRKGEDGFNSTDKYIRFYDVSEEWNLYYTIFDLSTKTDDDWIFRLDVNNPGDIVNFDGAFVYEITDEEESYINSLSLPDGHQYIEDMYPFVDGMQSVTNPYLVRRSQNLLPPPSMWGEINKEYTRNILSDYKEIWEKNNTDEFVDVRINHIPVIEDTIYSFSMDLTVENYGGSGGFYLWVRTLDDNMNKISSWGEKTQTSTGKYTVNVEIPSGVSYINLGLTVTDTATGTYTISNPMLNFGPEPLPFEPMEEDDLYINTILTSSVDGSVKDELYQRGDKYYKWKTHEVLTVDGSVGLRSYVHLRSGYKIVSFEHISDYLDKAKMGASQLVSSSDVTYKESGTVFDSLTDENQYYISVGEDFKRVFIAIPNTDSGWGEDYTPSTEEIRAYFDANPYTLQYQLEEPYEELVTLYTLKIHKKVILDGSKNWRSVIDDRSGYKVVSLDGFDDYIGKNGSGVTDASSLIKFNQISLEESGLVYAKLSNYDQYYFSVNPTYKRLYITISDADSGWGEDYIPNTGDIKSYFSQNPYTLEYKLATPVVEETQVENKTFTLTKGLNQIELGSWGIDSGYEAEIEYNIER
ncbi:hypothetical protein [Chengkuizengella marina]|uniref:Uncharacterized protein n=1 Tax=Chengkuizengella marina TaxID=2507566 RepID=A0A6N9PZ29_9BACL|nr:hypothetical protein [Chengkuizengella marina]NBI28062.1 hypothetical protein [Chengkuizengella marina]